MATAKPRKPASRVAGRTKRAYVRKNSVAAKPVAERKVAPPAPVQAVAPVAKAVVKTAAATRPKAVPAPAPVPLTQVLDAAVAAAEPITDAITKGPDMAATDTLKKNAAYSNDRVQALFGDVNGRAQTALEKSTKLFEEVTEFTKGNVEAIVASGRVAAKGAETIGQDAAEYGKKSFEQASATLRSFAAAKSPTELFQLQSDFAKSSFDALVAESSKLSESFLKLAGDIAQPLSSRFALAAEKVKSASTF